jgi:hypothetical protein
MSTVLLPTHSSKYAPDQFPLVVFRQKIHTGAEAITTEIVVFRIEILCRGVIFGSDPLNPICEV